LQDITNASFPNTHASRYRNVYVLMLKWADEDPNLPVSYEVSKLQDIFVNVYWFETEVWDIPNEDYHDRVNQKILGFKRMRSDSQDDLKIVYYGGHGKLTRNRSLAWTKYDLPHLISEDPKRPTVKWGDIQGVLEEARSDVLLFLDCCHSGTLNTNEGKGITELISSCDFRPISNGVGPFSFTTALMIELLDMAKYLHFSVLDLYRNIYSRTQGRMPEDGRERHPAPVNRLLTNDRTFRQTIQLSVRPQPNPIRISHPVHPIPLTKKDSIKHDSVKPHLALAVRLDDSFTKGHLPTEQFAEWLRLSPGLISYSLHRSEDGYFPES
ncbi:hypothetical protein LSUE1_G005315, partial [Lachnellula suecica]